MVEIVIITQFSKAVHHGMTADRWLLISQTRNKCPV